MTAVFPRTVGPPLRRRARRYALALAFVIALLALAHTPDRGQSINAEPGTPTSVQLASFSSGSTSELTPGASPIPTSGSAFLAGADPCAALFGSVKQACENFGKGSGSGSGPALTDIPGQIEQAIDGWFGNLVKSALTPVLSLFGELALATPNLTGGQITQIWEMTLGIADACFVLFAVIGGVIVMTRDTVQSRYGLKQILPRLVFAFIAANTSLLLINQILTFGNALTLAVWNTPVSGAGIGNQLLGYIMASIFVPDGVTQIFMILFGLVLAVMALAVVFSFALRTAALLLLTILAGPMLLCHALPGLDEVAKLWWRALAAVLAIEFLQAAVLMLMLQVFFDPNSNVLGVPTAAGIVDLLVCGALFVILLKIPNWVMRMVLGRSPRSSTMGLVRAAATAAIGTAIGVPGVTSARSLAGRLAGKASSASLTTIPPGPRPKAPRPPRAARVKAARPNYGSAHGRPARGGQGVLFTPPSGARVRRPPAPGGPVEPAETGASPTSGPGWIQPALFPKSEPGPLTRGSQLALFPLPHEARTPRPVAPAQAVEGHEPSPSPTSGPGWIQPALFPRTEPGPLTRGRQLALFPLPHGARTPRLAAPRPVPRTASPVSLPSATPRLRAVQPGLFPRTGVVPDPPVPRPVGKAPSVAPAPAPAPARAAVRPAAAPVARLVPVRLAAPAPPAGTRARRERARNARMRKAGG